MNISNFNGSNTTVTATVDSVNEIFLSPSYNSTGTSGVTGTGKFILSTVDTMKLHFTTVDSGTGIAPYSCDITMIKE